MRCVVLAALLVATLAPSSCRGQLELGARRLESLPGERWLSSSAPLARLAVARVSQLGPADEAWLEWSMKGRDRWLALLRAGVLGAQALEQSSVGLHIRLRGAGMTAGLSCTGVQDRVRGFRSRQRALAGALMGLHAPGILLAARWQGSVHDPPGPAACRLELLARAWAQGWGVGLSRESSIYAHVATWAMGMRWQPLAALCLAARLRGDEAALLIAVGTRPWGLVLSIPLLSEIDAGPALGLDWRPGSSKGVRP